MNPDEKKYERRFRCPICQEPIFSRKGACRNCGTTFRPITLFSCPRCGALVKQDEFICPACNVKMTDWGILESEMGSITPKIERRVAREMEAAPAPKPPSQRAASVSPATRAARQRFFDLREKKVPPPAAPRPYQRKTAPTKITRADAMRGRTNGTKAGRVNGTQQGRINGNQQGRVNGTKQGRVNGTKDQFPMILAEPSSRWRAPIAGRLILWQLIVILGICAILVSSAIMLIFLPANPGQHGIIIDGNFSDWADVASYRFSDLLPGMVPEIAAAKLYYAEGSLYMYFDFENAMFSGSNASTIYAFIDTDGNPNTGYGLGPHFGADRLVTLTGWDGAVRETGGSQFRQGSDQSNWSMWQGLAMPQMAASQREVETSIYGLSQSPKLQLLAVSGGEESRGPIMSTAGTIIAVQQPKVSGGILTNPLQSIMTVSMIAMGAPGGEITVQSGLVNSSGAQFTGGNVVVGPTAWSVINISADFSKSIAGDSFSFTFGGTMPSFNGSLDVLGEPAKGYYLSTPSKIAVDGLFGDWNGIRMNDSDVIPTDNPNIDIKDYGAATQSNSHFFYMGVNGRALGGADVPEQRSKTVPGGPPSTAVMLRKTGEDLLQVFIDKDPGMATGKWVMAGNYSIFADYLIEVYGRGGAVTSSGVKSWSNADQEWKTIGGIEKIGVGANGVEFSVSKTLLGNLTNSDIIFFTTDWKARSDNCWLHGALSDPWASSSTGSVYQSTTGASWSAVDGSIPLVGGEHVVDMCTSVAHDIVFVVSDAGRLYEWDVGVNTTWSSSRTLTTDNRPASVNEVVSVTSYGAGGGLGVYILNKSGNLWYVAPSWTSVSTWTYDIRGRVDNYRDFKGIFYNNDASPKDYVAIRETQNTGVYIVGTGGNFPLTPTPSTKSTSRQVSVYATYIGGATKEYRIWVLCENGKINYTSNGDKGASVTWVARGNLPAPGSGSPTLPSYSKYVGISVDSGGTFWVITNTSYCYKSTDSGVTWTYTGNFNVNTIATLATPLPEFESVMIPIMATALSAIFIMRRRRN